jgi:hypothetical protein
MRWLVTETNPETSISVLWNTDKLSKNQINFIAERSSKLLTLRECNTVYTNYHTTACGVVCLKKLEYDAI